MRSKIWIRAGYVIGAILLIQYWIVAYMAYTNGKIFAYQNYWNAEISTMGLFIMLIFLTFAWFWTIPKYWNGVPKKED